MRTNMQHDVKIPGRPAAPPGFTVAGRAQPGPRIDARWNAQCDLRGALPPPAAPNPPRPRAEARGAVRVEPRLFWGLAQPPIPPPLFLNLFWGFFPPGFLGGKNLTRHFPVSLFNLLFSRRSFQPEDLVIVA